MPATPGPSNVPQCTKRPMSDADLATQDRKRPRRNSSAEPSIRPYSNSRDTKRRKRRKKKAPIVSTAAKNDATHSRPGERPRAPLSVRNDIVRFSSVPSETDTPATVSPAANQAISSKQLSNTVQDPSQTLDDHPRQVMPPNDGARNVTTARPPPGPSSRSLEERVAQLEAELDAKNSLIASHQALLNQVQQAVTCQVCLDLMYKPYALAPCGHLACHTCLVNWFTAPLPGNRRALPAIRRRKTCPHCRAVVRARPVEVWGVKGIAQTVGKSGLLQNQLPAPVETAESPNANIDPWKDIFPIPGRATHNRFPWFAAAADVDVANPDVADGPSRGEDLGMLDMEDGGIYRCLDCMHEIWDGVCSSCGRVYPGHRPNLDEDDGENGVRWLEDRMGAEEVDVADDPGWMGLEDGEADDDGDMDDLEPWRRRFNMFRGPWGFLGTIHVDDEDEDDEEDTYGRVDDLRIADEDGESGDEGYESSFIDDGDDEGGSLEDGPRIYEIGHDEEDYRHDEYSRAVDEERYSVVLSSDEEGDERQVPSWIRGSRFESDTSNEYWSEE